MSEFPRTTVGGLSVSRMIIGTNWFLGYTHCTQSKTKSIKRLVDHVDTIADIIEVFLRRGVDTIMGPSNSANLPLAIEEAQQRVGKPMVVVSTPNLPMTKRTALDGWDLGEVERVLDAEVERGAHFCMPHTGTTDRLVDKCSREVRQMDVICRLIRERGMIPGLSTHLPETVVYADETDLDVETYIQIYNSMGFLMHIEVDWVQGLIQRAKKPVMTIKPMAAGQLRPLQAMTFVWNTIRDQDMVTVGTMSPEEADELIDLSLSILERRAYLPELQATRSKATVLPQA